MFIPPDTDLHEDLANPKPRWRIWAALAVVLLLLGLGLLVFFLVPASAPR
jgi:hypothetical protein